MLLNKYVGNIESFQIDNCLEEINYLLKQQKLSAVTRHKPHLLLPAAYKLGNSYTILKGVEKFLGTDHFVGWYSVLFIKKANTPGYIPWHYDDFFWGYEGNPIGCTAWVALGDVNIDNGAMEFVTNREASYQKHFVSRDSNNLLVRGNNSNFEPAIDDKTCYVELPKGGFSIHSNKAWHRSGPNQKSQDRLAIAFRYIDEKALPAKFKFLKRGIFYARPDINLIQFKKEIAPSKVLLPKNSKQHIYSVRLAALNTFFGDSHRSLGKQILDLIFSIRNKYLLATAKEVLGYKRSNDINEG